MTTKYESGKLILELYELRREDTMREARAWWWNFKPKSMEDIMKVYPTENSGKMRMVMGYWDMAAALVNHGAIDKEMFFDTNGEFWTMFAKLQPLLPELRKMQPEILMQLEKLIMSTPGAQEKLDHLRKIYG